MTATQPISIAELKVTLPCTLLQLVQARSDIKLRKDGKAWKGHCPFHRDAHPSFSVYWGRDESWRFHCPGCRADGDVFDWVRLTQRTTTFTDALNWLTNGRAAEFLAQDTPSHELGGAVTDPQTIQRINPKTAYAAAIHIRDPFTLEAKPRYWEPYNYGTRRRWIVGDLPDDVQPYPVGAGFLPGQGERARALADHPLVSFPKLVKTSRLATLFRLTDDWKRYGGELCVGFKYRLTSEASGVLLDAAINKGIEAYEALSDQPRWLARPGFTSTIPWEFDGLEGEGVDRLVILEGPG
ncbi:MAG: CHC2 zinc finger domain-containing protein, partial [Blastocatellia bacterium]